MMTCEQFWALADETRLMTEYRIDEKLNFLENVSLETLQQICLQYRYFTQDFPDNLGILISKLPQGEFKSLLGEILHEELGEGDTKGAHLRLYDQFLLSIGIDEAELENSIHPENQIILQEIQDLVKENSGIYGIGMVGMGGECLCQIYLATMYDYLLKNPYIQANKDQINWDFWTFHAGEADVIHRQKVRKAINDVVSSVPSSIDDLAAAYLKAKNNWDQFWNNNFNFSMRNQPVLN